MATTQRQFLVRAAIALICGPDGDGVCRAEYEFEISSFACLPPKSSSTYAARPAVGDVCSIRLDPL